MRLSCRPGPASCSRSALILILEKSRAWKLERDVFNRRETRGWEGIWNEGKVKWQHNYLEKEWDHLGSFERKQCHQGIHCTVLTRLQTWANHSTLLGLSLPICKMSSWYSEIPKCPSKPCSDSLILPLTYSGLVSWSQHFPRDWRGRQGMYGRVGGFENRDLGGRETWLEWNNKRI